MGKKLSYTPRSKVRSALRALFLRSRERNSALRREKYHCEICGVKQSNKKGQEVKLEVHHKIMAIQWDDLIDLVYRHLLCDPKDLQVTCVKCHKKEHENARS